MTGKARTWLIPVLLLGVLSAGGCSALPGPVGAHTDAKTTVNHMNAAQAAQRLAALLTQGVSAIRPAVTWQESRTKVDLNTKALSGGYDGTANVSGTLSVTTRISAAKLHQFAQAVAQRWHQQGYTVDNGTTMNGTPAPDAITPEGWQISLNADG
jgi:type II secretory pathway pseudopilin PulG